jgi:glycosyltransferase involved in cell wall biosynthesis
VVTSPGDTPEIAVVIPTRGRETRLRFALEALAAQTLPHDRFEVVVVRGVEAPGPLAEPPAGLRVRSLDGPLGSGPAAKRNLGWRSSRAPLIAFTDDDCRPDPTWLERLVDAAVGADARRVFQGRTEPDSDERHLLLGLARTQTISRQSAWYETCNIAYPRDLLAELGGFDESFSFGGEDTDLGLRALALGAEAEFVTAATVRHAVLPVTLGQALGDVAERDWLPRLLARHPVQRRAIYRGYFQRESHALFLLAFAGVVLAPRRPVAALAALPYLRRNVAATPRPRALVRSLAHLPARALVDALEVAVAVRGALRHRVLVL